MFRRRTAERKYPIPLTVHQLWTVSLGAPVSRGGDVSRTTLYPYRLIDDDRAREWLSDKWGITSRAELLGALDHLARVGYRTRVAEQFGIAPLAWDVGLYVHDVQTGFASGYVDEAEAWQLLGQVVRPVREAFGSWKEFADGYLLGRTVWMGILRGTENENFPAPQAVADAHLGRLLDPANDQSPWNRAPWTAMDGPDRAC